MIGFGLSIIAAFSITNVPCAQADESLNQLTKSEHLSGWTLLFDGENTSQWRGYQKDNFPAGWKVKDGALTRSDQGAGDIITREKYEEFELSLEYNISPGGNSGVMFHVLETGDRAWHTGPEIQVQDNEGGHDAQKAGWLYQLFKPEADRRAPELSIVDATRPAGQWNQLYVRISKTQCFVALNGVAYYRFVIGDDAWNAAVAKSKFAKFDGFGRAGSGHICLQDHGNLVSYRNIKVRRLASDGVVPQPIDGKLGLHGELAFPKLQWQGWQSIDEDSGRIRKLRIMELTPASDGSNRLFAAAQSGEIFVFENRPDVESSALFLNLHEQVNQWDAPGANEQGLLGFALHPKFKDNRQFFVCYTAADDDRTVVSRFKVSSNNPDLADPNSEEVLLEIKQPFKNHNGGSIEFGPDGYLYIALGDGGFRNDPMKSGQDRSKLLGKILRVDVDSKANGKAYGIPADNPFVNVEGTAPEVYAYGMRNPWRIAFDKKSGRLWAGDVGQELWEEVDVIVKGGNYGWSSREGTHAFGNREPRSDVSAPIEPIWEYDHGVGKSITGGRVYNGSRLPELAGKYLYADYVSGSVWALTLDAASGKAIRNEQVIESGIPVLAFGEDLNGEVYYTVDSARGECIFRFVK
ncbi:MAG: PQQ-dependent sugar dehydrogenase [Planctomycetales bacterium]|nr:PQQ-dependent sugar dehydrogenase [Planctomycetales bacterium]